jgi:hypothetical protein
MRRVLVLGGTGFVGPFADTSRIRRELGYAESVGRSVGLRRAIEWEREQQQDEPASDYTLEDAVLRELL